MVIKYFKTCYLNFKFGLRKNEFINSYILGDIKKIKYYIDKGIDLNCYQKNSMTLLHYACLDSDEEIIDLVLRNKANINALNRNQKNALIILALCFNICDYELFVADRQKLDEIKEKSLICARLLINYSVNINHQDNEGNTALHHATSNGNEKIVRLLISNQANIFIKNKSGETAFMCALSLGNESVLEEFLNSNEIKEIDSYLNSIANTKNIFVGYGVNVRKIKKKLSLLKFKLLLDKNNPEKLNKIFSVQKV